MGDEESNNTDDELGADDGFDGGKLVVDIENAPVERTATKIIVPKELPASSIPSTATTSQHAVTAQEKSGPNGRKMISLRINSASYDGEVRPEAWNPGYRSSSSGPRSLFLRRSENGFGFTLRHFIVYPPESYAILAGDKRLGLRNGAVDEPMDTIFVKNVRENSPASEAGLTNGDRIVSVNGENIAGLPYAKVIQLIQKTGNYLHLSVVPKENDILQLYFGETAHNPETNRRPGFHLSDPSHFAVNLRDDDRQGSNGSSVRRYARRDTSPAYPGIGAYYPRESRTLSPSGVVPYGRRSSEGSNSQFKLTVPTLEYPSPMSHHHHQQFLSYPQGTSDSSSCGSSGAGDGMPSTYPCNTAGCRLSLDAGLMMSCTGTGSSRDSSCDSSGTTTTDLRGSDDSLMSRIRKSLEQKEEFLRRPAYSSSTATVPPPSQQNAERPAKELYAVPQKLTVPTWPPNNQQPSSPHPNHKQESSVVSCEIPSTTNKFKNKSTSFASTLDKIQENAIVTNVRMPADNNHNRNHGTAAQINAGENVVCPTSPFQLVTLRARQFESGVPCEDKTDLYRSELARLSSKKNVINVASRKREFESKAYTDRKAFAARESRSLDSQKTNSNAGLDKDINKSENSIANTSQRSKPVVRQDSYLAACSKPTITKNHRPLIARKLESSAPNDNKLKSSFNNAPPPHSDKRLINDNAVINSGTPPCRPNQLPLAVDFEQPVKLKTTELFFIDGEFVQVTRRNDDSTKDENDTTKPAISVDKVGNTDEDEKNKRRISYLKATSNDQMTVDSEYELSDSEIIGTAVVSASTISSAVAPLSSVLGSRKITGNGSVLSESEKENQAVIKEGSVLCKVTLIDGKKATDRSWKPVWLVLKGPILCVYKERRESLLSSHSETPAAFDRTDLGASCDRIDIRCSMVEVACDYTKRKHVFRLNAPSVGAELLLQTDDTASMTQWVKVLQEQALIPIDNQGIGSNVSPNVGNKTIKKLTYLRNRSPTGESPVTKTRKPTQTDQQQSSPKSKTWKNRMAKQFRRIQQGGNSPVSPTVIYPTGATIGIPLEICPSSTFSEYVPLLVEICTNIVEARGLEIIGIYRVPGNTAAVSSLTEAVNRGLDPSILDQDSRWQDVNVISSLLKSFFRRLPDSLLTSELYPHFIKADKIEDPLLRMTTIRKLLRNLPDHNYETLRYLMFHLKKIVNNSAVNKMEAKNLAIVFGPTLVRTSEDNMVTMVTDMSHQCRIVESLISHVDWCFGDSDVTELKVAIPDNSSAELEPSSTNHNLLLGNIRKVEGMQSPVTAKDIVSTIIGAANRKMQKAASKHSSTNRSKSTTSVITSSHHTSSNNNSEDTLDGAVISRTAEQRSSNSRNWINRENESKLLAAEFSEESRSSDSSLSNIPMQRETSSLAPESLLKPDSNVQSKSDDDSTNWTYAGLSATTQERIRRFEQETKAMLQRELTRQKRVVSQQEEENKDVRSGNRECENVFNIPVETEKKRISPDGLKEEKEIQVGEDVAPLVVNRRNLSAVNGNNVVISNSNKLVPNKKIKTGEEIMVSALPRSESLDSLHQSEHSSSRVSEESNDLLMSLTSTFDKKLKTLLMSEENEPVTKDKTFENGKKDNFFRDPSLHKSPDKQLTDDQENEKDSSEKENEPECKIVVENYDNNNGKNIRNGGRGDIGKINPEKILKFEHLINQNKSALSMQNSNSQKNGLGKESKLFYSNSVKVRRSDSFNKYHDGSGKLRRSGSLNKSDRLEQAKISKFESLILMKNAEAVKLKRSESLTKNEKTESNIMKRRQQEMRNSGSGSGPGGGKFLKDKEPKLKRKNGILKERNIKRRHTVGGTKDFDKSSWLDGKQKKNALEMNDSGRKERRTSSPDLSSSRLTDFLVEVIVRPRSFVNADPNFVSRLFNIPLESHV